MSESKKSPSEAEMAEDTSETNTIDGEVVDVTARNNLLFVGTGLVGGIVGAALVGAGFLYLAPQNAPSTLDAQVAALSDNLTSVEELLHTRTNGLYSRISNAEEAIRVHTDQIGSEPIADRLQALQGHAAQVQEELARFEDKLATVDVEGFSTRLTALEENIGRLSTEVRALENAQLPADLPERVGQLAQGVNAAAEQINSLSLKLTAVEEALARPDPTAEAALGIAIANLTRAIDAGLPFVSELNAIAALAPEDPAVAALREVASTRVLTFAALKTQFSDLIDPLLVADRQAGRETFWERFVGNVLSIVTVRRVGDVEGDSTEALVARIEAHLQREDLDAAVREARKFTGAPGELIAPWIAQAEARVKTAELVRALSARVLALVVNGEE